MNGGKVGGFRSDGLAQLLAFVEGCRQFRVEVRFSDDAPFNEQRDYVLDSTGHARICGAETSNNLVTTRRRLDGCAGRSPEPLHGRLFEGAMYGATFLFIDGAGRKPRQFCEATWLHPGRVAEAVYFRELRL